jgi:DNA polymerase III subunit gamma/tau
MEKFIVSARKYRPSSFGDVVGQQSITTTLKNSILNRHLGHAYLFSGPRGVGKTTCARIFAKSINCSDISETGEACNQCESCRSFNEQRSFSIHELDAASNNSVDDIRSLTEKVRVPPQIGSYSIYIIDEVHMLSQSAFNAFLKTLEEPPAHAIFVLATTEKHKIIPTILSRCQIFDFNRIRVDDAVEYLAGIAGKEGIGFEPDALHVIARKADGAMRDALSIFDQVVSFSGGKITYQDVISNLNILDYEYFFKLTNFLLDGDVASSMLLFNEILSRGFDARNFINGYAAHLRDLMVCKDPATITLMEVGAGIRQRYQEQSAQTPLEFVYDALEICNQADIQFRASRNQRLTIELALVKLARLTGLQKKKELADLEETPAGNSSSAAPVSSIPVPEASTASAPAKPDARNHAPETGKKAAVALEGALVTGKKPGTSSEKQGSPPEADRSSGPASGNVQEREKTGRVSGPTISIRESLRRVTPAEKPAETEQSDNKKEQEQNEGFPEKEIFQADPDRILKSWDRYAASVEKSRPRTFSTLTSNRPVIRPDGIIVLLLNSQAQRDHFMKVIKPGLISFIEENSGDRIPDIIVEVAEMANNGRKIYTDQDKLDFLMTRNPDLGVLKSRLGLDFDE